MKGILPKLLAKENITIQHGNYHTAWFDIKNRVLGLPMWKDMGKDVYDLLIGHEVGHALETPYEGWHDNPENLEGCPRSYINVIEDARIERKVKSRYPGLVRSFQKGYAKLWDEEFFGKPSEMPSWDQIKLIDKINLEAKVGAHLDVPFTDEEQVFMDRAMTTESFDEVVELVRDILAWTQENQEELLTAPDVEEDDSNLPSENGEEPPQGHDDMMSDSGSDEQEAATEGQGETEDGEQSRSESPEGDQPIEGESQDASSGGDIDESMTDRNFRRNEDNLIDEESLKGETTVGNRFSKDVMSRIFQPYSEIKKLRAPLGKCHYDLRQDREPDYEGYNEVKAYREEAFVEYMKDVKRNVNYAVKEFEQRKAAFRYTRSQTAKTGSIDVNKLWSYKTNEDIFNRVTRLADAKNHGMFMLIDFSGSMSGTMDRVLDQLIHLVVFCKTVNIPFDVYGFSTCNNKLNWESEFRGGRDEGQVDHENLSLTQQISSELKKSDYTDALRFLYYRKTQEANWAGNRICEYGAPGEDWGSTPLNTSLVAIHDKLFNMIRDNGIDNMNLVVLTDGETNTLRVNDNMPKQFADTKIKAETYWNRKFKINMGKGTVTSDGAGRNMTADMLDYYRKFGITTLGFFLANDRYQYNVKLSDVCWDKHREDRHCNEDFNRDAQRQNTRQKCVIYNDAIGYDTFYIVQAFNKSVMNIDADDFDVDSDATKAQITQAFKKHSKGKKLNKTLLTNFGKAVAV